MLPIKTFLFYPTILIHGIGGDSSDLQDLKVGLENNGVEVYNIEIGNGKLDSIIWNINKQCEVFSENINNLSIESNKINIREVDWKYGMNKSKNSSEIVITNF